MNGFAKSTPKKEDSSSGDTEDDVPMKITNNSKKRKINDEGDAGEEEPLRKKVIFSFFTKFVTSEFSTRFIL